MKSDQFAVAAASLIIGLTMPTLSEAKDIWFVRAKQLQCVKQHIDQYSQTASNDIIIFLDECPNTDLASILSKKVVNSAVPTITPKEDGPNHPAEVIQFTKGQLKCLKDYKLKFEDDLEVIEVPKDPCS
ncbi:hypothetical protein SAMN04515647_0706 [Cohaesibacter sp. ES.047]|uniref:hypothetical protein n=1 Tax=Cohaesibacter sp. ES.047 TaxID=1798205 RepID=UPI000BBF7ED2|nr:hypothetical protein [Cohaesibacter sp. ES.047]SNY90538.1 hypothetical protein SAMN04515647_0706 [Cohaesibacter sp. ES.047]